MSMQPHPMGLVPPETARIARLAFPKGIATSLSATSWAHLPRPSFCSFVCCRWTVCHCTLAACSHLCHGERKNLGRRSSIKQYNLFLLVQKASHYKFSG